ncbi:SAM-dependent methyltransferase [Paenibacillus chitinolyticus]|uniref:SAM-dependent methyltransferase n=1 Tax=Paenibacillus chitinolyticus TaxID=79263 RepID=A0A410X183_9BACL|nr:SAM-dependent methyltransferase [Paenibacillus chitinolyticus]MCY9588623.1 SAM-dependent methyltransferase [Paenibacillus chitinolyticus]MCY9597993.1 SAM-dependent methyltransferase [Paenibacillus chitinolyticus]QAV20368.1 SAM-dependent methyltransferase [Paenibacillus chitinolyticus]
MSGFNGRRGIPSSAGETAADAGHPEIIAILKRKIEEEGPLPFRDYMTICLYHPEFGYYRREETKIGRDGDFYTSSNLGSVMGEIIAGELLAYAVSVPAGRPVEFVEFGGGTGRLARHVLDALRSRSPERYASVSITAIESSAYHRALQRETLREHADRLRFLTEAEWLAEPAGGGVFAVANELADAMPVHRVRCRDGRLELGAVGWDDRTGFTERWLPLGEGHPAAMHLGREGIRLAHGQQAEVNLGAGEWITRTAGRIRSGRLLLVDYGDTAGELYASHRMNGTLMCYRRHIADDNPYAAAGRKDITAHVDFTACMRAAWAAGWTVARYETQREFLVRGGILGRLVEHAGRDPFSPEAKANRAIRQLLISDGMSELFKVLTLEREESRIRD